MSYPAEQLIILQLHGLDIDTTGDKGILPIPQKCVVERAEVCITSADAGGGTVSFDLTTSAAAEVVGSVGSIVVTAADNHGKVFYDRVANGNVLNAGDFVTVDVKADAGAGATFSAYLILRYQPETEANQSKMVETA